MMNLGFRVAGQAAQGLAQVTCACGLAMGMVTMDDGRALVGVMLVAALLLPFRTNESDKSRALGNFGAGLILWGWLALPVFYALLEKVMFGDPGNPLTSTQMVLLVSTILYMSAGAFYWVLSRNGRWS